MRVYVSSLGCKLNQSEMDTLAAQLAPEGHQIVASPAEADLCVFNTCAVTHVAAQKSRQALRRLHRENPTARLIVTGCYAELTPADLYDLPGVELVVGNRDKEQLADLIDTELPVPSTQRRTGTVYPIPSTRTRALVKIQDGCDNACTYCIIHVARGRQRSRRPGHILADVKTRLADGHKEIVLTGVHIGAYGQDRDEMNLWLLVDRILAETDVPRLRLSSIEPWDLTEQAFALWENPRLCRHLHLPLQSGSSSILRRMNRRYTTAEFATLVASARAAIPGLAVTTDVIVGFPGETDAEFADSLAFVRRMGFAQVHVFPYSLRPGTPAAEMPGQVAPQVRAERARAMRAVAAASARTFRQGFVGRTMDVLWESGREEEDGLVWNGLTDNYLRVRTISTRPLRNTVTPVRLTALNELGLQGQIEIQKSGG